MRSLLLALALSAAACQAAPQPDVAAVVAASPAPAATDKIHVSPPQAGTITVTGDAGAIAIPAAVQILVGCLHDLLGSYLLLHAGNIVVVGSAKVPLVGGGFGPVQLGDGGGPAQRGDRVLLIPKNADDLACGEPTYLDVP